MANDDTTVRRSGRIRTQISYQDLAKVSEGSSSEVASPETSDTESVSDSISSSPPRQKSRASRPRKDVPISENPSEIRAITYRNSKRSDNYLNSREGRLSSISGTNVNARITVLERLEKWKDVLTQIPEELLDFTIGWGVCTGDWHGEGGAGQNFKVIADGVLSPFHSNNRDVDKYFKPTSTLMQISLGKRNSQKIVTLDTLDFATLCIHLSTSLT